PRFRRDRSGESEPHVHAAGVGLYRLMNELANFCKALDLRKQTFGFGARETHERAAHENIFDAGEFEIKTGAQFEQRGYPSVVPDISMGGFESGGDDLQQCGLAAAVLADDARRGSGFDFKADIPQRPKFVMPLPAPARERLFQAVAGPIINPILF